MKIQSHFTHKFNLIVLISLLISACAGTGLTNNENTNYLFKTDKENLIALAQKVQKMKNKDVYDCDAGSKVYVVHLDANSLAIRASHDDINPKYILFKKLSGSTFRADFEDDSRQLLTFNETNKTMHFNFMHKDEKDTDICKLIETSLIKDIHNWH